MEVGEIPVVMSGDGLIGQIGGALARQRVAAGDHPGRSRQRPRQGARDPFGTGRIRGDAGGGARARDRRRRGEWSAVPRDRLLRVRLRRQPDRERGEADRGNLVYAYAALRALAAWRHARFTITLDGSRTIELVGYSVVVANSRAYGGGMFIAPHAELDDGKLDVVLTADVGKLRYLAICPRCSRARTSRTRRSGFFRASGGGRGRSGLRRLRRREHLTDLPARLER